MKAKSFNVQVDQILLTLKSRIGESFGGEPPAQSTLLALAKEMQFLKSARGRNGGTWATPQGMTFAGLSGEIITPKPAKAETADEPENTSDVPDEVLLSETQAPVIVAENEVP